MDEEIEYPLSTNTSHKMPKKSVFCFYFPNCCLIIIILLAIALAFTLAAIFIEPSLNVNKYALYNENCLNKSCIPGLNLKCIDNICQCDSYSFYQKGCQQKKRFFEACYNSSNQCMSNGNLTCLSGVCKCNDLSYWNGQTCLPTQSFNGICQTSDMECKTQDFLNCDLTSRRCLCSPDR